MAAGTVAVGLGMLALVPTIDPASGYAGVGARFFPLVVGVGLALLGAGLLGDAWRDGFFGLDEARAAATPTHWRAFAWASGAIIAAGLLIQGAGFVIACTVLFVAAARAFGDRRFLRNALTGLVLSAVIFAAFNYGLGLTLPAGILPLPG